MAATAAAMKEGLPPYYTNLGRWRSQREMKGNNDGAHGERTKEKPKRYGGSKKNGPAGGRYVCCGGGEGRRRA